LAQTLQTEPWRHYFPEPDLAQTLQTEPWRQFGLFGWVYMTWLRLCRLSPGVITFQKTDLVQPLQTVPWRQLCSPCYHGLAWFSLTCSGPVTFTGLWPLGASVVTVDVDVVVVVDVVCRSGRKLGCPGPQISRVVTTQKYNQLIWLSSLS
jgi:hypothetical protein